MRYRISFFRFGRIKFLFLSLLVIISAYMKIVKKESPKESQNDVERSYLSSYLPKNEYFYISESYTMQLSEISNRSTLTAPIKVMLTLADQKVISKEDVPRSLNQSSEQNSTTDDNLLKLSNSKFNITNTYRKIEEYYFISTSGKYCYKDGTAAYSEKGCTCKENFYWVDCGLPSAVWDTVDTVPSSLRDIRRRKIPRRIINGVVFNHEFELLEARVNELQEVVEIFIILESKYSSLGMKKSLRFLEEFRAGFLKNFQHKILYVSLDSLPKIALENGWAMEMALRYYVGSKGLARIKGLEPDDIFVLSDADEIPTAEVVTFLKLYEGFPEPVAFTLKWNVFGFFWQSVRDDNLPSPSTVNAAASIRMIRNVFFNNVYYIRKKDSFRHKKFWKDLAKYKSEGGEIGPWNIGSTEHYAGWHCSWCFRPEGIVLKMDSAQMNDTPRWGDFPEKRNLRYIQECIKEGRWFDGKTKFRKTNLDEPLFAPPFIIGNFDKFRHLLVHPTSS